MSNAFRELVKTIGSGPHTGKHLSRVEARAAMGMMLEARATPAQIGAFLIAHRIKRPTAEELAGMLDAYDLLGPKLTLPAGEQSPYVFGVPYDGRSRTAPVTIVTALLLAAAGIPVLLHGGTQMPTKYGIPLVEIWQGLEVDVASLSLAQSQRLLDKTGLGFVYLPQHFPLAHALVVYRDEIGKRPPLATLELMWLPGRGASPHAICGYVHPPTETLFRKTFALRGVERFTTIKGLEGSCDLPLSRPAIVGHQPSASQPFERLCLHPSEYGLPTKDIPLESPEHLFEQTHTVIDGRGGPLQPAVLWNGGFHLWHSGLCPDLAAGLTLAERLLAEGAVASKLQAIQVALLPVTGEAPKV